MPFFKKRGGPEDFYGTVAKAIGTRAMARDSSLAQVYRRWREEFDVYGLPAPDFVEAWFPTPPANLAAAWKDHVALLEKVSPVSLQMLLSKLHSATNGYPISATSPPTIVILAWRRAGCADPREFVRDLDSPTGILKDVPFLTG